MSINRSHFRFSLRTLFVVVTICAVACPFGAHYYREYQKRKMLEAEQRRVFEFFVSFGR